MFMRILIILSIAACAAPAFAQDSYSSRNPSVVSVNSAQPDAMGNVTVAVPSAASTAPPAVADSSATGNMTTQYALANHTHASKVRKNRVLVPASGSLAVTFSSPFTGIPLCSVAAETSPGDTNVVNAQIDGQTTMTGFTVRITRTQQSVVALLGLTILSVPTQVATYTQYICVEP